jgi:hypothetical protein
VLFQRIASVRRRLRPTPTEFGLEAGLHRYRRSIRRFRRYRQQGDEVERKVGADSGGRVDFGDASIGSADSRCQISYTRLGNLSNIAQSDAGRHRRVPRQGRKFDYNGVRIRTMLFRFYLCLYNRCVV